MMTCSAASDSVQLQRTADLIEDYGIYEVLSAVRVVWFETAGRKRHGRFGLIDFPEFITQHHRHQD